MRCERTWKEWIGAVVLIGTVVLASMPGWAQQTSARVFVQSGPGAAVRVDQQGSHTGSHWIGILCREADEVLRLHLKQEGGLVVEHVVPKGPAEKAGIRQHDVLLKFDDAPLAKDLRVLVRERLVAGDSDDQVRSFLVARYGEFVLLKPTMSLGNLLLWLTAPVVILIGAAAAIWRMRKASGRTEAELTDDEERALAKILEDKS